jgi:tricorn protease interacting factor F2/3
MASGKREILGTNVLPLNYKLSLDTNLNTFKYRGDEVITVMISKPTNSITLNAKFIKVISAFVESGKSTYPAKVSYDKKFDRITLKLPKAVSGKAFLNIEFWGENQYNLVGFYRSKYTKDGKEAWLLTTQFEAVYARNAFPCFDEPALKATFDLSLVVDSNLTALSNMPIKSEIKLKGGRKTVAFRTTPKMSTYLLYIGVGPFDQVGWKALGIDFRILTTPGKSDQVELAKEFATKFMAYQQSYFRVKYPLPKMDFIAIPDFQAGAMENWGAITAREIGLLGTKAHTSVPVKRYIALIVSHELAHQWFGDLVTMAWWNDLWLNESFATFIEEKSIEAIYPKWQMRVGHIVNDTAGEAMGADQLKATHPIHVDVNSPSEIDSIFDSISYQKGSAVLRMLEDFVTPEVFRDGLKTYFTKNAYSNTEEEDLWKAIASAGGSRSKELPSVAHFWIRTKGFPIVHADGPRNGVVKLKQSRFTILPNKEPRKNWPIPIHYITDKGEGFLLMKNAEATIKVPGAKFIKLNLGQKGFYRASYSSENLAVLGKAIKAKKLSALDSWGVINDMISLAKSCKISVSDVLDFIEKYCMDCEYPVSSAIASYFSGLTLRFYKKGAVYKRAKRLEAEFGRKLLKKLGWQKKKDELHYVTSQRSWAITSLGTNGDRAVVAKARKMFNHFLSTGQSLESDLKQPIYKIVAANGGAREFSMITKMAEKTESSEEQRALYGALGELKSRELNLKSLAFALSKSVRPQDKTLLISLISSNPIGKDLILSWTMKNWQRLKKIYHVNSSLLSDPVECLMILQTKKDLKTVNDFFKRKSNYVDSIDRPLKNTLEAIEINARFVDYNS